MSESVCQSALADFTDVTLASDDNYGKDEEVFNDGEDTFEEVFDDGEDIFKEVFVEIKERSKLVIKAKEVIRSDGL